KLQVSRGQEPHEAFLAALQHVLPVELLCPRREKHQQSKTTGKQTVEDGDACRRPSLAPGKSEVKECAEMVRFPLQATLVSGIRQGSEKQGLLQAIPGFDFLSSAL